jgi:hypothetical protein
MRRYRDAVHPLEGGVNCADVFLQRAEDRGHVTQDSLGCGDGEESWEGGREDKGVSLE